MSPSSIIAGVVVALLFCAWVFQTDSSVDPNYENYVKRQAEDAKRIAEEQARMQKDPNSGNVIVTESNVTKQLAIKTEGARIAKVLVPAVAPDPLAAPIEGSPTTRPATPVDQDPNTTTKPAEKNNHEMGFPAGTRIEGVYVGVTYIGDKPRAIDDEDVSSITFHRDGSFSTRNMGLADVDMEAATGAVTGTVDRGSGKYKLSGTSLEIIYTDGLARKKGNKRGYTVLPVNGDESHPTALSIQGKVFKIVSD